MNIDEIMKVAETLSHGWWLDDETWPFPPQSQWVGLKDEDMNDPRTQNFDFIYGARWAESKLKERNNG